MNYTRWMDMMVFMLSSLKIYYIFYPNLFALPEPQEDEFVAVKTERLKYEENKVLCQWHILNHIFFKLKSPKKFSYLRDTLQAGKIRF
jgi:hypothetical protein